MGDDKAEVSYLSSTFAPAASSFSLISLASASGAASLMVCGAESTFSLASFRPRPVISRTTLITLILEEPASTRTTSKSVFASAAAAPSPAPAAAPATATGRSGNAEFFFQSLYQLRELHNLELFNSIHNLLNSHGVIPPFLSYFLMKFEIIPQRVLPLRQLPQRAPWRQPALQPSFPRCPRPS